MQFPESLENTPFKQAAYSQSMLYCSNEDTSLNDFYIMTLSTGDEEELLSSENLEESHFSIDMENEEESQEEQDGL